MEARLDPPILNLNRLSTLLDSEERSGLFQLFLESAAETLDKLKSILRDSPLDNSAARHELHGFKGACISIGAEKLASLVKLLETQIRESGPLDSQAWLEPLDKGIAELRDRLAMEIKA